MSIHASNNPSECSSTSVDGNPFSQFIEEQIESQTSQNYTQKGGYPGTTQDLKDEFDNAVFTGAKTYQTLADFNAVSPVPEDGTPFVIANDPNEDNNGKWSVQGGVAIQNARTVENTIDENNTTKGVTGQAVYKQGLYSDLTYRGKDLGTNLFNKDSEDNLEGYYINSNGDLLPTSSTYTTTHFIKINEGESLNTNSSSFGAAKNALYDKDFNPIFTTNDLTLTWQTGAEYARFVVKTSLLANVKINKGLVELPYESYTEQKQLDVVEEKLLTGLNGENNLTNQDNSSIELVSGGYNANSAKYKINLNSDVNRIVFDFYDNHVDTNLVDDEYVFVDVESITGAHEYAKVIRKPTETLFRQFNSGDIDSLLQARKYNSGYKILDVDYIRDGWEFEPLVGETAFMIWLKGDEKPLDDFIGANQTSGNTYLADREQWLSNNRDYALVLENDTFSIVRDGIDVDVAETPFNGGATSTIFTTSLKVGGVYKSLATLYNEIKAETVSGGSLENLYINFYQLSARKDCGDLLQFGKQKLVGKYRQNIVDIDQTTGGVGEYYDAFPFEVKFAKDEKKHVCEIIRQNDRLYIQIDGIYMVKTFDAIKSITIGAPNLKIENLEVYQNGVGDAEIITSGTYTIISSRSPYTVGIMGHIIQDDPEEDIPIDSEIQSTTVIEDACQHLIRKKYQVLSVDDLVRVRCRNFPSKKRLTFFVFDDEQVDSTYINQRHRQSISKYGMTINPAVIIKPYADNLATYQPIFTQMRTQGWVCHSHSLFHNYTLNNKNSVVLKAEFVESMRLATLLNMNSEVLTYNFRAGWETVHAILKMSGYALAILNNAPYNGILARNRYMIGRVNLSNGTSSYNGFLNRVV